jgi:hypothetical protein
VRQSASIKIDNFNCTYNQRNGVRLKFHLQHGFIANFHTKPLFLPLSAIFGPHQEPHDCFAPDSPPRSEHHPRPVFSCIFRYIVTMEGYAVILEKKARGRGMGFGGRPWAVRTFKLTEQNFEYYDGAKLKGVINTKGSKAFPLNPSDADGKEFPFQLNTTDGEQVILNGSSWAIRDKCIAVLNRSSVNPRWDNAEDNEKYKLEARLRELEHERLGAVTSGAAGAFGAGGADAAMKKAQEAQKAIAAENVSVHV